MIYLSVCLLLAAFDIDIFENIDRYELVQIVFAVVVPLLPFANLPDDYAEQLRVSLANSSFEKENDKERKKGKEELQTRNTTYTL